MHFNIGFLCKYGRAKAPTQASAISWGWVPQAGMTVRFVDFLCKYGRAKAPTQASSHFHGVGCRTPA